MSEQQPTPHEPLIFGEGIRPEDNTTTSAVIDATLKTADILPSEVIVEPTTVTTTGLTPDAQARLDTQFVRRIQHQRGQRVAGMTFRGIRR